MTPAVIAVRTAQVAHTIHQYEHQSSATAFGREAAELLGVEPDRVFKTLVLAAESLLAIAIVPVASRLDLKAAAVALEVKKVDLAESSVAERTTGYVVGGISPLGQRRQLTTLLDSSAFDYETIFVSGGRRGLEIELAADDLARLTGASVSAISQ